MKIWQQLKKGKEDRNKRNKEKWVRSGKRPKRRRLEKKRNLEEGGVWGKREQIEDDEKNDDNDEKEEEEQNEEQNAEKRGGREGEEKGEQTNQRRKEGGGVRRLATSLVALFSHEKQPIFNHVFWQINYLHCLYQTERDDNIVPRMSFHVSYDLVWKKRSTVFFEITINFKSSQDLCYWKRPVDLCNWHPRAATYN